MALSRSAPIYEYFIFQKISDNQWKLFKTFKKRNRTWREQVHIDDSEDAHPWQQYRQTTEGDIDPKFLKDTQRFKPKHKSLFKVKTSTKQRY